MKRLLTAAGALVVLLAVAPQLHAQATKKPDSTAARRPAISRSSSTSATKAAAVKSDTGKTAAKSSARKSSKKRRHTAKAKADTAKKGGE